MTNIQTQIMLWVTKCKTNSLARSQTSVYRRGPKRLARGTWLLVRIFCSDYLSLFSWVRLRRQKIMSTTGNDVFSSFKLPLNVHVKLAAIQCSLFDLILIPTLSETAIPDCIIVCTVMTVVQLRGLVGMQWLSKEELAGH